MISEQTVEHIVELSVIWVTMTLTSMLLWCFYKNNDNIAPECIYSNGWQPGIEENQEAYKSMREKDPSLLRGEFSPL